MVGSAIMRRLARRESIRLITRGRDSLDLARRPDVEAFFESEAIDAVVLAAARVGGIHANNTYPADFIHDNLVIACNVIDAARRSGVNKLL